MRTRTRAFKAPTGCSLKNLGETFVDQVYPVGGWKPGQHDSKKVTGFSPLLIRLSVDYLPPFAPHTVVFDYPTAFPSATFAKDVWSGAYSDVLTGSVDVSLPAIDVGPWLLEISRSSTNLAEAIATFKDSIKLFTRPGKFLAHAKRSGIEVSKRPLKELSNSLDRAADTWLQGTYGYIPLMHDLVECAKICRDPKKALAELNKPISKKKRQSASFSQTGVRPSGTTAYQLGVTLTRTTTVKRVVQLDAIPNPTFFAMSLANQMATYLGLNDFGRLAWELCPYSFVADWFTSLGERLSSASGMNGHLAYMDARVSSALSQTTRDSYGIRVPDTTTHLDSFNHMRYNFSALGGCCEYETKSFTRSVSGQGDSSGRVFNNGLSAYRTATGLALLLGPMRKMTGW